MAGKKRRPVGPIIPSPPVGPRLEYRHAEDDAWYNVQLLLSGDTLTVKFMEFPDDHDVVHRSDQFTTPDQISELRKRFRPLSLQFEASDCASVEEGMRVCAIRDFDDDGRLYYDAIVETVKREEHTIVDGTEKCSCHVVLSWLHGPECGTLTLAKVEDLCPIQSSYHVDPRLACFLELAKWKLDLSTPHSNLVTEDISSTKESSTLFQCKKCKYQTLIPKSEGKNQPGSLLTCGNFGDRRNEDVDLGGEDHAHANVDHSSFSSDKLAENVFSFILGQDNNSVTKLVDTDSRYFILVENLEKDVSPSTIVSFIQEETGLKIEAFVFLSLAFEPYTRGALVVDCVEDLERLCDFVVKPEQMIVSSKGRPWIVIDPATTESMIPSFWCLEPDLENERQLSAVDGLKVVKLGSDEYSKAEKLRDIFRNFTNHQQKLSERLALEEQRVLNA